MKRYIISILLLSFFVGAFKDDHISLEDKLTIVLVYQPAEKGDKEGKQNIRKIHKSFKDSSKDRYLRRIGIRYKIINLSDDKNFEKKYISEDIKVPCLMFFEGGSLLNDETVSVTSAYDVKDSLDKKLKDKTGRVGKIVQELKDDYEEHKEDLEKARVAASYSIVYSNPWDYYNGWYSPYYAPRYHYGWAPSWGFGVGFGSHYHRRCR